MELSDATRTVRPISLCSQWSVALCMASNSSTLMWSVFSVVIHTPDIVNAFQCAPQPMFDASVNNWVSGYSQLVLVLTNVALCEERDCQSPAIHHRQKCGPI